MSVSPVQRYTAKHPCPVCGGHQNLPKGSGIRCYGFISSKGRYASCSQLAGSSKLKIDRSGLPGHRLGRKCACGEQHAVSAEVLDEIKRTRSQRKEPPKVEVLGPPTKQQVRALKRRKVITKRAPLTKVGAKRVRCWGKEWLGLPAVRKDSWKLLAISGSGGVTYEPGKDRKPRKICRRNVGPASFIAPKKLATDGQRLYDVEGETDLLRALDLGLCSVICTTSGAASVKAYESDNEFLKRLNPSEVAIIRDLDEAGESGYTRATGAWHELGVPARQVRLPDTLGEGGDLRDLLNRYDDLELLETLTNAAPVLEAGSSKEVPNLTRFTVTGDQIAELMSQPEPESPLPGFFDPDPHLHVLMGKPKLGKTTFALLIARAWAGGISPWPARKPLPGTPVLVFSAEQPTLRIARILKRLDEHSKKPAPGRWLKNLFIFGADQRDPVARQALRLDPAFGLEAVRKTLRETEIRFGLLVFDSLARVKPPSIEENDNDAMTGWLDELERIALDFDCYVLLIHHEGHGGREDPRSAARGASAIAAVASALWLLKRDPENPRQRIISAAGSWIADQDHRFQVCDSKDLPLLVNYFRPATPDEGLDPRKFLKPGETVNSGELDRRILGLSANTHPKNVAKKQRERARGIRYGWEEKELITWERGPRRSKLWSLAEDPPKAESQ